MSAEAGADALGFIFAPFSKRLVSPQVARQASLSVGPTVARVGVFLNQGLDEVLRLAEAARMSAIQLHGQLSPEFTATVAEFYPVIRAVSPNDLTAAQKQWHGHAAITLMIDAPQPGGGLPLDWDKLRGLFPAGAWLAAGLGPENVAEAIRLLCPSLVDAVSKLEQRPGIKNPQAVKSFVDAVKGS